MFFTKHKKIIVGLATAAVIALGSTSSMAASTGISLTPVGYFDSSKVDVIPGTFTVVEAGIPHIEGGATATTDPDTSLVDASGVAITAISNNVDASDILGDNFTVKTLDAQDLHPLTPGQNYTTAAK